MLGCGIIFFRKMSYIHHDPFEDTERQDATEARAVESGKTPEQIVAGMGQPVPMGRVGQPAEFGAVVAFLASEKASYVNGVSIPIDGGIIKAAF